MNIADIRNALTTMAFDTPAGQLNSNDQSIVVRAMAPVSTPEDFENIIIKGQTKIRDVATVTMGPDIGTSILRANGKTGIGLGIIRQAQSNTLDISKGVRAAVAQLQQSLTVSTSA
jgi:HAE1 family hydrophobic/amphiphilic exporter-1